MRRVFGPRTIVEAAFLVAVPVIALVAGFGKWTIVGASAVAYLLVLGLEATIWREGGTRRAEPSRPAQPAAAAAETAVVAAAPPTQADLEHVRVLPREEPPPVEPERRSSRSRV